MKIAIENSITFQKSHIKKLEEKGEIVYYDPDISKEEFYSTVKDCNIIVVDRQFYNSLLPELKQLKLISIYSTGHDFIDTKKAMELGIYTCNVPNYSSSSVAEHIFALILGIYKKITYMSEEIKKGKWWHNLQPVMELNGKTIGIIGYGNIGKRVRKIAEAFEMNVIVNTGNPAGKEYFTDLEDLLKKSDIVTLCVPLTEKTTHLINRKNIALMKTNAILINCSRGKVVNEQDLIEALKEKKIAGAGLDVFRNEPLNKDSELFHLDNAVLTPHVAFYTKEALERLSGLCLKNIISFVEGEPQNIVL